jgi:hypothetical protein
MSVSSTEALPYRMLKAAKKFADATWAQLRPKRSTDLITLADVPAELATKSRIKVNIPSASDRRYLLSGGPQRFLEYCPVNGCLAVILNKAGALVHAYPYRPAEYERPFVDLPYERPYFDPTIDRNVFGLAQLDNGDLIVVFNTEWSFPHGGGVARVDKEGYVVWFRSDYTHHWPALLGAEEIGVLTVERSKHPETVRLDSKHAFQFGCKEGYGRDVLRLLDLNGRVKKEFRLIEALTTSRYRNHLMPSADVYPPGPATCDPLHANYVRLVGPELAGKLEQVEPDDFLISLRNLSAIGILSRRSKTFTYLFRGTFLLQHGAQPVPGGKIALLDNLGAAAGVGPSRLMLMDPSGAPEETLFPKGATPPDSDSYTAIGGHVDMSADGRTALVSITEAGKAYEVDMASGKLLTIFDNLHDLRSAQHVPLAAATRAGRFKQWGVYHARDLP